MDARLAVAAPDLLAERDRLAAKNERLRALATWLINDVQEWCDAVGRDSSWSSWDDHYKSFVQGGLEQARAELEGKQT